MSGEERREFQRIRIDPPIDATFAMIPVTLVEAGVLGARVHHNVLFSEKLAYLRFNYDDHQVTLRCGVVRTIPDESNETFTSGLRLLAAVGDSAERLRKMLADLVSRELDSRRTAPLSAVAAPVDGDRTVRGVDAGYLSLRYEDDQWHKKRIFLPEQPPMGFTVARSVDNDEVQRLCQLYQASDEEGRRLIRAFAELSVGAALQLPPRA